MRFEVRYRTTFTYEGPVVESQNELRVCPASDEHQQLLHFSVGTEPASRTHPHQDYWGTHVDAFGVRASHESMTVTAEATVETGPRSAPPAGLPLADLADPVFRDDHFELLQPSKRIGPNPEVSSIAEALRADAPDDIVALVQSVQRWVHDAVTYSPGATLVGTTLDELLRDRKGVCQDYAHLAVAICRALSIPARYVSGYLFTGAVADADGDQSEVTVKTHAWFEAAIPGNGWLALDPTNDRVVDTSYITIGRGRDYDDVPPIRGAYLGPDTTSLDIEVRLRRLAAAEQQQQQQ